MEHLRDEILSLIGSRSEVKSAETFMQDQAFWAAVCASIEARGPERAIQKLIDGLLFGEDEIPDSNYRRRRAL
jgi:hypothetical protein